MWQQQEGFWVEATKETSRWIQRQCGPNHSHITIIKWSCTSGFGVQVLLQEGQYQLQLQLHVPEQYPEAVLQLELQHSNLPPDMVAAFLVTARSMVSREVWSPTREGMVVKCRDILF